MLSIMIDVRVVCLLDVYVSILKIQAEGADVGYGVFIYQGAKHPNNDLLTLLFHQGDPDSRIASRHDAVEMLLRGSFRMLSTVIAGGLQTPDR